MSIITVTFETNGGSKIDSQMIEYGELIEIPNVPIFEGYYFINWYRDDQLNDIWNFNEDIPESDITLYAKWIHPDNASFDVFFGWYLDEEFTVKWDFNIPPTNNLTLHARWEVAFPTIKFETFGGTEIEDQTIPYGDRITRLKTPSKLGYVIEGWYTSVEFSIKWDFYKNKVYEDMTLYAKWIKLEEVLMEYKTVIGGNKLLKSFISDDFVIYDRLNKKDKICVIYTNGKVIYKNKNKTIIYNIDVTKCKCFGFVRNNNDNIQVYTNIDGVLNIINLENNVIEKYSLPNKNYFVVDNSVTTVRGKVFALIGSLLKASSHLKNRIDKNQFKIININDTDYVLANYRLFNSSRVYNSIISNVSNNLILNDEFKDYCISDYVIDDVSIIGFRDDGQIIRRKYG